MHYVMLSPDTKHPSPHFAEVVNELTRLKAVIGKTYETWVASNGIRYRFVTTSTDIHLALGRMAEIPRSHLACLIDEVASATIGQSAVFFEPESKQGFLAVLHKGGNGTPPTIYLSPAH